MKKNTLLCIMAVLCLAVLVGCTTPPAPATEPTTVPTTVPVDPTENWETGFVAAYVPEVEWFDEGGASLGMIPRGTQVRYGVTPEGRNGILLEDVLGYLQEGALVLEEVTDCVLAQTLYVRTAVNLRDAEGNLLEAFAEKGAAVEVTGCDFVDEKGAAHMYRVSFGDTEGYIMPWYVADAQEEALKNYDAGSYTTHVNRGDRYGGGDAAALDYFPREKAAIAGNEMPEECRTLYLVNWRIKDVDSYIALAEQSGINAFVVDITDGEAIGYDSEVMKKYSPSAAAAASNTVEEYQTAIKKLKDAGYYVIGRITTFNDYYFVKDHPEYAIADLNGTPLRLSATYWPTPYNRTAWQFKTDLAVEAVELMGFNEIQFDYVRFPDSTWRYEQSGNIDFRNTYNESKAQAIQRFLMYAADRLHEKGAYVSADVYGEGAYTYVTAYGQYWPAISNVVDAISGMPYPDHFAASGDYRPWEHPYDTIHAWGECVALRQKETATPAAVRTWIQAYNAIREPYNRYGSAEVAAQIKALRDTGCTGGYMTWNPTSSLDKYYSLISAFEPPTEG